MKWAEFDELIAEMNERGVLLNNFYQLKDKSWIANVRDTTHGYEFGEALTPEGALKNCLQKVLEDKKVLLYSPKTTSYIEEAVKTPKLTLEDLLGG